VDDPVRLDWRGTDNLYGRVGPFLQPKRRTQGDRTAVATLDAWADDPASPREFGSISVASHVWDDPDPAKALGAETLDPTRLFKLAEARPGLTRPGARQGPFGPLPTPTKIVADARPRLAPTEAEKAAISALSTSPFSSVDRLLNAGPDLAVRPMPRGEVERPANPPANEIDLGDELPEMPVMPP